MMWPWHSRTAVFPFEIAPQNHVAMLSMEGANIINNVMFVFGGMCNSGRIIFLATTGVCHTLIESVSFLAQSPYDKDMCFHQFLL